MKKIKYKLLTRSTVKNIFWTGLFSGAALYVIMGSYAAYSGDLIAKGLETVGIILMTSTLAFFVGMHYKIDEE